MVHKYFEMFLEKNLIKLFNNFATAKPAKINSVPSFGLSQNLPPARMPAFSWRWWALDDRLDKTVRIFSLEKVLCKLIKAIKHFPRCFFQPKIAIERASFESLVTAYMCVCSMLHNKNHRGARLGTELETLIPCV